MKNKILLLFLLCCTLTATTFAQSSKEDKEEKKARIKDKTDYNTFHHQMLSLKEYADERKKIPALQKANKMTVKVVAVVDTSGSDDGSNKTLTGYIRQDMGDNSNNVYEVTFDRAQKKIIAVKHTGEGEEVEKEDAPEKKTSAKKTIRKKSKDDDDDDADDDDNTTSKKKDKDDDN
jgi:hypothetical protein